MKKKSVVIVFLGLLALLGVAVGGYVVWSMYQENLADEALKGTANDIASLQVFIEQYPKREATKKAHYRIGAMYFNDHKDYAACIEHMQACGSLKNKRFEAQRCYFLSLAYDAQGDYACAITYIQKALATQVGSLADYWLHAFEVYEKTKATEKEAAVRRSIMEKQLKITKEMCLMYPDEGDQDEGASVGEIRGRMLAEQARLLVEIKKLDGQLS